MIANRYSDRVLKIVGCACFLLIAAALVLIDKYSPATGYELSIYDSLPAPVWVCLIAAIGGGIGMIVHQAFAERRSKHWALGFGVLIFGTMIVLLLPVFRAYFAYGMTDAMNHSGETRAILSSGHFAEHLMYPIVHLLMAQLHQVSGAPLETLAKFPSPFFTGLFMLYSYLLASVVMPRKGAALLVAAASGTLFFGYYHVALYPQALSIMTLPLVFYLYFKGFGTSSIPFRAAFVIILLQMTYFHPAPAGVLIVCLLATEGAKMVWKARGRTSNAAIDDLLGRITPGPTLIAGVTFLTWISSYYVFSSTVNKALWWLTGELRTIPRVAEVEYIAESQGLTVQQQIELGLKMYGDNLVFLSLSALALLLVVWGFLRGRKEIRKLSLIATPFLISGPAWILIFASTLFVTMGRLLGANIMMWATPVLAAFALYWMFGRWRRAGVVVVTGILLFASVLAILGVYHSPYILGPSWQVTHHEVQGMRWFLTPRQSWTPGRFASLGVPPALGSGVFPVLNHFGYPDDEILGGFTPPRVYLVLARRFEVAALDPTLSKNVISAPSVARRGFDEADFLRLRQDPAATMLYSNGELDIYLVRRRR